MHNVLQQLSALMRRLRRRPMRALQGSGELMALDAGIVTALDGFRG